MMETVTDAASALKPEKDKCLFDIYRKEGDDFFMRRKFKKAMDSYSLALTHQKHDLTTLVARSRCYLNMGLAQHALADVERALDLDTSHSAAVYQKAQVLYRLGHYEMSLTFFNKGRKMNPDAPGFAEGMEKAEKAITVGRRMKMTEVGDISMYIPRRPNFTRRYPTLSRKSSYAGDSTGHPDALSSGPTPVSPSFRTRQMCKLVTLELQKKPPVTLDYDFPLDTTTPRGGGGGGGGHQGGSRLKAHPHPHPHHHHRPPPPPPPDPSAMLDVLSQLYTDKAYFEKILRDIQDSGRFHEDVFHMAGDGLAFVAERMLFWAEFGAQAPIPSDPRKRRESKNRAQLKPYKSSRPPAEMDASREDVTSKADRSMTSFSIPEDEMAETWVYLNEVSEANAIEEEQEIDLKRRRRRGSRSQRSLSRVSGAGKKRVKRRRRQRKRKGGDEEEEDDDLTLVSPKEAAKLQFNFQSNRPGNQQQAIPSLTLTTDTGETDTEWDETDAEMTMGEETDLDRDTDNETDPESAGELTSRSEASRLQRYDDWLYQQTEQEVKKAEDDPIRQYLIRATREIAREFENEEYLLVRERVHSILADLDKYKPEFMADKMGLVATLHSLLGNAYLEVRDLDHALKHHKEDLRIGEERSFPNIKSRALGNLGRTHVFCKEYIKALDCFAQKSSLQSSSTPMECAWLYHEMANCFLQLKLYEFSRDAAATALDSAVTANSSLYQLQAAVLLAVSEVKLKKYEKAHDHFTLALDQAKLREDAKAESSIRSALKQVNDKMAAQARDKLAPAKRDGSSVMETPSMHASLADDWDAELAPLKDDESILSEELRIINTAAALVHATPLKTVMATISSSHGAKVSSGTQTSSLGHPEKRPPSIIVPPPSRKRLQREQELKKWRECKAADRVDEETGIPDCSKQVANDDGAAEEGGGGDDPTKEMAVRFRSFVSEIPSIGEEGYQNQRERTTISEAPKTDTVVEDPETPRPEGAQSENKESNTDNEEDESKKQAMDAKEKESESPHRTTHGAPAPGTNENSRETQEHRSPEDPAEVAGEAEGKKEQTTHNSQEEQAESKVSSAEEDSAEAEQETASPAQESGKVATATTEKDHHQQQQPTGAAVSKTETDSRATTAEVSEAGKQHDPKTTDEDDKPQEAEDENEAPEKEQETQRDTTTEAEKAQEEASETAQDEQERAEEEKDVKTEGQEGKQEQVEEKEKAGTIDDQKQTEEKERLAKEEEEEEERQKEEKEKAAMEEQRQKEEKEKATKIEEERLKEEEDMAAKKGEEEKKEEDKEKKTEEGKEKEEDEEEKAPEPKVDPVFRHLLVELAGIEEAFKAEDGEGVVVKAQAALEAYTDDEVQGEEYQILVAKLHSFAGSGALLLEDADMALHHHHKDLSIGEKLGDEHIQARALENIGRSHVTKKDYEKGLEAYVKRLQKERDDDTSARVFHELANCFFHMHLYTHARDSARLAVQAAGKSGNSLIRLQSSVLMAVCHVKDEQPDTAYTTFESALKVAIFREDADAEEAIREAMRSLRKKQVQMAADKFKEGLQKDPDPDPDPDPDLSQHQSDRKEPSSGEATDKLLASRYDNFLDFGRKKKKAVVDEVSPYRQHFQRTSLRDVVSRVQAFNRYTGRFASRGSVSGATPSTTKKRGKKTGRKKSQSGAETGSETEAGESNNKGDEEGGGEEEEDVAAVEEESPPPEGSSPPAEPDNTQLHVLLPSAAKEPYNAENDGDGDGDDSTKGTDSQKDGSSDRLMQPEEEEEEEKEGTIQDDIEESSGEPPDDAASSTIEADSTETTKEGDNADDPSDDTTQKNNTLPFSTVDKMEEGSEEEEGKEEETPQVKTHRQRRGGETTDAEDETTERRRKKKKAVKKKRKDEGVKHRTSGHPYMTVAKIP